ncbi:hypothetical protein ACFOHY_05600 [Rhizobium rosettiformans]|uniref:hypothetical protein n=1 Tax=Rhizobium rosettiformans TaxID=1368430 RepID=UPI00360FFE9C
MSSALCMRALCHWYGHTGDNAAMGEGYAPFKDRSSAEWPDIALKTRLKAPFG